jgi:hypothetical protein
LSTELILFLTGAAFGFAVAVLLIVGAWLLVNKTEEEEEPPLNDPYFPIGG